MGVLRRCEPVAGMYRVNRRLSRGEKKPIEPGSIIEIQWLPDDKIQKLINCGAVTRIAPPPLDVLPGWERRAVKLEKMGITNVVQLLTASVDEVAAHMKVKPATVLKWMDEARNWLIVRPGIASG